MEPYSIAVLSVAIVLDEPVICGDTVQRLCSARVYAYGMIDSTKAVTAVIIVMTAAATDTQNILRLISPQTGGTWS
jgi:hypothetical protein